MSYISVCFSASYQRGLGRSSPTFMVEECTHNHYYSYFSYMDLDAHDEKSIRNVARIIKARNLGCWNYPGFSIPVDEEDESSKHYHFLKYSGTRQLAEDIERVRILFGNQKLSVYGISYGTAVMGTYSTIFPLNVNLLVLDGNIGIGEYDVTTFSTDMARSTNSRIDYFIASCEMGNICAVNDMEDCVNNINTLLENHQEYVMGRYGRPANQAMMFIITGLFGNYDLTPDVCSAAENNDFAKLEELIIQMLSDPQPLNSTDAPTDWSSDALVEEDVPSESKPTAVTDSWPWPGYLNLGEDPSKVIWSQDFSLGACNENMFVKFVKDVNDNYPGAGTQGPVRHAVAWYGHSYYWPGKTPLPPMGNVSTVICLSCAILLRLNASNKRTVAAQSTWYHCWATVRSCDTLYIHAENAREFSFGKSVNFSIIQPRYAEVSSKLDNGIIGRLS